MLGRRWVWSQTDLDSAWTLDRAWGAVSLKDGLPFPSPWDLPDPGIELGSPALEADSLPSKPPGKPIKASTSGHV